MNRLHIEAKDDHVLRIAHRDQPVAGIIELIWNSLDAEAHKINVVIQSDAMDAVELVRVEDDGHGIAPEAVPSAFQSLGGSWKATAKLSPNLKRRMNGTTLTPASTGRQSRRRSRPTPALDTKSRYGRAG